MVHGRDLLARRGVRQAALDQHRRVDGRGGPALHPLHLRLDRQAQGRDAHHRRLPGLRRLHPQDRLRLPPRRHLLLRRRRRLGHRPHVHRLRPARQRRHHRHVRVRAHVSRTPGATGRWWTTSASTSSTPRPPRSAPSPRPATSRSPAQADEPAHPRLGGRAHQPGDLEVVPRRRRREPLRRRRHLVADRDGRHPHHAAPGRHAHQAGLGHAALLRRERRSSSIPPTASSSRATASRARSA